MDGRRIGSPGGARARSYITARLKHMGIPALGASLPVPFALTSRGGAPTAGTNLVGVVRGTRFPERYIVLSAHYDHVGVRNSETYRGADDNASGTSGVLAIATWLKANPPAHSVIVALFDGEESGLLGSKAFVAALPVPRNQIIANLNLDMVSRNDRDELWAAGATANPHLRPMLEALARDAPVTLKLGHDSGAGQNNWTSQSDHGSFHAMGIPWVYFGVEDHPDYHKPTDVPDRVPQSFFFRSVTTVAEFVRRLDLAPPAPPAKR